MDEPMVQWLDSIYADETLVKSKFQNYLDELTNKDRSREDTIASIIAARMKNNYDVIAAFTGTEGSGKSLLAQDMGGRVSKKTDVDFDTEVNTIFHQEGADQYEIINKRLYSLPFKSTMVIDEAIKTMYSRNWNKKQQKEQNIMFTTIRERNMFVPLCIPALMELDTFFKNFRVSLWIHIFARGKAGLFVKDSNPFNTDPFNTRQAKRIIDEHLQRERFDVDNLIKVLHEYLPNFITWFNVEKVESKFEQRYRYLKNRYTIEIPKEEITKEQQLVKMQEDMIVELFQSSSKWTAKKLAEKFNLSENKVKKMIKKARGEPVEKESEVDEQA